MSPGKAAFCALAFAVSLGGNVYLWWQWGDALRSWRASLDRLTATLVENGFLRAQLHTWRTRAECSHDAYADDDTSRSGVRCRSCGGEVL